MAQEILNSLLTFKIQPKDVLEWLITDNFNDIQWVEFNKNCQREEFIIFFLNYLKDQFASAIHIENNSKQIPSKKILSLSGIIKSNKIGSRQNNFNSSVCNNNHNISDIQNKNSTLSQQSNTTSIDYNLIIEQKNSNLSMCINNTETRMKYITTGDGKSISVQNSVENLNFISSVQSPSTPVFKKKNSIHKQIVELIGCDQSQRQNFNVALEELFEFEKVNLSHNKNISCDKKTFTNLGKNSSSSLNISNVSNHDRSETLDLFQSNMFQKSNFLLPNKILQSPVSPLYSNSMLTSSPINANTHNSVNSTSENIKASRQSFSLGDFIITESRNVKKSVGKKNNNRKLFGSHEQKNNSSQNVSSDTSCSYSEQNTRRRKVNPTRINVKDQKGNNENTVFGVISRPFTPNPQFTNVSPIDKSVDNASFQVERGLVKIERQKKTEPIFTINTDTNTKLNTGVNLKLADHKQPRYKILPRTPNKVVQPSLIIIPSRVLVHSSDVLDALAELYSGFLDHNLIVNPMTELYFLVHLITAKYTDRKKLLSNAIEKIHENEISTVNSNNSSYDNTNFLPLRKSLNFDDSLDEKVDEYIKLNENISEFHVSSVKLDCLKSKDYSINEDYNKKFFGFEEENKNNGCQKMYFLGTPHNCVYFSTQVLNRQKSFIKCLDRVTLKLLYENNQIATFHPQLCQYLDTIYNMKVSESNKLKSILNIRSGELNVCFQKDTDNRETFPSNESFLNFKKQRDMFYEILKIWEDNHLVSGWSFQIALSGKIKTMLTIHTDITNFTHFTRLFKSQMLISCIQFEQQNLLDDETVSFLKNLKDNNPEKLTQLQRKLITPLSHNGPVPLPSFPGIQEFYKDFILHATHPMFYNYLENTFIHEIMELSNSEFTGSDIEENVTEVDEQTKKNFAVCLSSLRLLAKFLGFITSLPYRSETSMLEDVIYSQISLRKMCLPRIDIQHCLQIAVIQGKLSLIVPWVIEYLAMMDHASLRLPYYKRVLEMLYCIYRASNHLNTIESEKLMSKTTATLVKLLIGWLFELPVFPKELYYICQSQYDNKVLRTISESQHHIIKFERSFFGNEASGVSIKGSMFLDKLEIVDDHILYSCCPFLKELNILLKLGSSNVNSNISYKHVTPVTSQLDKSTEKTNTKHLEIQLEEAFFHGQPMSTTKTVEYISERVASTCVKHIYNNLLPIEKKNNSEILRKIVEENYNNIMENNIESLKNYLLKDVNLLSNKAILSLKAKCQEVIPKICESRITQSIHALLAEDCLQPVKDMCVKIAIRMAMERIDQWVQSHIVEGYVFIKDMEMELSRAFKDSEEIFINKNIHNLNTASPTNVINNTRKIIWDLLETQGQMINMSDVSKVWDQIYQSLTERCDLKLLPKKLILSLSVDLCLFLITFRVDLFTTEIQEKVLKVWKINYLELFQADPSISKILSSRNILLMSSGSDSVWYNFGKFLRKLLKENILSIDSLNEQAIALLRIECPIVIMKNLSVCLRKAIDGYTSPDEYTERIKQLLEWVAGACSDMDKEGFDFL